jgi:hypothetical protein
MRNLLLVGLVFAVMAWTARAADPTPKEFTGTVGCAKCDYATQTKAEKCAPVLKVGDDVYFLKLPETAAPTLKDELVQVEKGKLKGDYTVLGVASEEGGKTWITVTSLTQKNTDAGKKDDHKKKDRKKKNN